MGDVASLIDNKLATLGKYKVVQLKLSEERYAELCQLARLFGIHANAMAQELMWAAIEEAQAIIRAEQAGTRVHEDEPPHKAQADI